MRIVHTSDWHLGHTLHDLSRRYEHAAFLDWLLGRLEALKADALIVAGDVFDTANPPADAQSDFFGFLAEARRRMPRLGIVVVGGNHDSASRLDAPEPILAALGVHVVGGLPRGDDGCLDLKRLIVPLKDAAGRAAARVVAMPFLRPSDLPVVEEPGVDPLVEGVRRVYAEAVAAAEAQRVQGEALVGVGHLYMVGTALSELSERKVLGGNQHALPVSLFPPSLSYVALGHLHLAQQVGRPSVRYSGSPIPLSFSELSYPHQVCVVDLEGDGPASVTTERIPRAVELHRVPSKGPAPLDEVLRELAGLHAPAAEPRERWPLLEVQVLLPRPEPTLRADVERALEGKGVRLARIASSYTGDGAVTVPEVDLDELQPEEVLRLKWSRDYGGEPPAELLSAFHETLDAVLAQTSEAA
jgi:exonuclease SbcD